ncbi:TonB-dependent receptor [Blastomonas fulva]|uniref:TonB-dependent receptor n=1 Tax=Blastomonas fulva TaxID=1550728 RepID=UPI003F71B501
MGRLDFCLRTTISALSLTLISPAWAQSTNDAPQATDDSPLGEIVVTAQRRQQSLQDVPIAVSAFSGEDLAAKQIRTTIDIPRLVPNMVGATNVGIGSANTYFIRGLGNTESIATFDPPVGTYVDDIYVSRQNANNFAFFDVDRIEVLRGPQGTLFGRNTTGGAINVILKKPADTLGGYVEAGYGAFDRWVGRASVDIPINEKILSKFSVFGSRSDGYVRNLTTGERNNGAEGYGVRGALRFLPTDNITWDVSADFIRDDSVNLPSTLIGGKLFSNTGLNTNMAPLATLVAGRKANFVLQNITKNLSITSNLEIQLNGATLSFITGYRDLNQDYLSDLFDGRYATGGFAIVNAGRFKQFSQEVKIDGSVSDTLQYTAGLFYIHEDNTTDFADVFTLDLGTFGVPLVLADRVLGNKTSAPAAYAQFNYKPTDSLTVTIGARYTSEKKTVSVAANPNPALFGVPYGSADIQAAGIPLRDRTNQLTPRVAIEYRPAQDTMLFASATRGFRSGGWNARALSAENFLQFGPEKVWSYEAGFRTELFDRTLRLNATAFYTDVNGFQVPLGFVDSTGAINFVTQNGSDFRNYGLEAEAVWVPVTGLSLFANMGLQRAKYLNPDATIVAQQTSCRSGVAASCGQGIVDPQGNLAVPQRTPRFSLAVGGTYDAMIGDYIMTPATNATYQSRNTVGSAGVPGDFVDGEWLVGASLTFKPQDGPWKIAVECANCFDNNFVASNFPPGFAFYNMPQTWQVTLGYTF